MISNKYHGEAPMYKIQHKYACRGYDELWVVDFSYHFIIMCN